MCFVHPKVSTRGQGGFIPSFPTIISYIVGGEDPGDPPLCGATLSPWERVSSCESRKQLLMSCMTGPIDAPAPCARSVAAKSLQPGRSVQLRPTASCEHELEHARPFRALSGPFQAFMVVVASVKSGPGPPTWG